MNQVRFLPTEFNDRVVGQHYFSSKGKIRKWNGKRLVRTLKQARDDKHEWKANRTAEQRERDRKRTQRSWVKRYYNMTEQDYDQKYLEQGGRCPLCLQKLQSWHRTTHCDHMPGTGVKYVDSKRVKTGVPVFSRGLLCSGCNSAMERVDSFDGWGLRAELYKKRYLQEYAEQRSEQENNPNDANNDVVSQQTTTCFDVFRALDETPLQVSRFRSFDGRIDQTFASGHHVHKKARGFEP